MRSPALPSLAVGYCQNVARTRKQYRHTLRHHLIRINTETRWQNLENAYICTVHVGCIRSLFGLHFGVYLASVWGPFGVHLGSIWGSKWGSKSDFNIRPHFGLLLTSLGTVLGPLLGPKLALCWRPWSVLGRSWAILEPSWVDRRPIFDHLGTACQDKKLQDGWIYEKPTKTLGFSMVFGLHQEPT